MKVYQYSYTYIFNGATVKTNYGYIFDTLENCKNHLLSIQKTESHFFRGTITEYNINDTLYSKIIFSC